MDESKAISSELKGLFETIKRQAIEYSRAFEFFEKEKQEIIQRQNQLTEFSRILATEVGSKIHSLETKIDNFLSEFDQKTASIESIYKNLSSIESMNNNMSTLHSELKIRLLEVDNLLKTLENRIEKEFESLYNKLHKKLYEELDTTFKKLEVKYVFKFKSLDEKIINFDQKLLNLTVNQSNFSKTIYDDIETIRTNLHSLKQIIAEERMRIETRFTEFSEALNKKLIFFDQIANQTTEQTESATTTQDDIQNKMQDEIRSVFHHFNDLRQKNIRLESKLKIAYIALAISIVGVIIGFFLLR
jgi:translation initiation factor 2 alpha subunit (eIF-2alpha)